MARSSTFPRADFQPAWWLPGAHLQTLWPVFFRAPSRLRLRRERFELSDGDFVDLDWGPEHDGPLVLLLHGLEGGSRSHYVRAMLASVAARGWLGVVLHFRGCSGEPNRLPRSYHSGDTGDLAEILHTLGDRVSDRPIYAAGFSLGGNVLLKYLGEHSGQTLVQAAAAVCVPMVLEECAARLERGFSRLYQWWLLGSLKRKIARKFGAARGTPNLPRVLRCRNFRSFDDLVTAPLHGFRDADHYYRCASARQYLRHVGVPTLVIHANDDPFLTERVLADPADIAPEVRIEVSDRGGHLGFVEGGIPLRARYWLEKRITDFFAGVRERQIPNSGSFSSGSPSC